MKSTSAATAFLVFALAASAAAGEPAGVPAALARKLLSPGQATGQIQAFADARVPAFAVPEDAAAWDREAARLRKELLDRVVLRGIPPAWTDGSVKVEWLDPVEGGAGYRVRRLRFEAVPGMWIPALLYEPERLEGKIPVMLAVNGHVGAPGKAIGYKQIRCVNLAKRGMLVLNVEWIGMGQLGGPGWSHARLNQLDLCGTSGLAPFLLSLRRSLDILLAQPNADPARVAVSGLSGGGWQTMFVTALDTRVTAANPVAGHAGLRPRIPTIGDLGDSEQMPSDLATLADYVHLTALAAPRWLLLTYNSKDDCCFQSDRVLPPLLDAVRPVYRLYAGPERLRWHVNDVPGTHNFERENREACYRLLGDAFYPGDTSYDATEMAVDGEVKAPDALNVALPEGNADLHALAAALSRGLPRGPDLPAGGADAARAWQAARQPELRAIARMRDYAAVAEAVGDETKSDVNIRFVRLRIDDAWTLPAVELAKGAPKRTVLLVADAGRASAAAEAERRLAAGERVIAFDPAFFGEARPDRGETPLALLLACLGERALGVEAGQIAAVARWAKTRDGAPVMLAARGPRLGVACLVAAALETDAVAGVELDAPLGSLHEAIEGDWTVDRAPELFCFGLLEQFDVRQIAALVAPRPVTLTGAGERARAAFGGLAEWYGRFGVAHDPLGGGR